MEEMEKKMGSTGLGFGTFSAERDGNLCSFGDYREGLILTVVQMMV